LTNLVNGLILSNYLSFCDSYKGIQDCMPQLSVNIEDLKGLEL